MADDLVDRIGCQRTIILNNILRGAYAFASANLTLTLFFSSMTKTSGGVPTRGRMRIRLQSSPMQRKIFWLVFLILGLLSDFLLPIWWALAATLPIIVIAWWVAYRSDWF